MTPTADKPRRSWTRLFVGAQIAAIIGTAVDFVVVYVLTEFAGIWYAYSNALGAACGAVTNFLLGRYWVFQAKESKMHHQAFRYFLVATGSLILNTLGVYLLTEFTPSHYMLSKTIVAIFIAVTFNFLLQKKFVFRR